MNNKNLGIKAVSREYIGNIIKDDLTNTLLVDTYNGAPLNMKKFKSFNPFFVWPHPRFPVPGMHECKSRSLEAVWQGTKLIDGVVDRDQFLASPHKRPAEEERDHKPGFSYENTIFSFDGKTISHLEARFIIYLTSYLYLLEKLVPDSLIRYLHIHINLKHSILFYDWDSNFNIENIKEPFSHSAILQSWFSGSLEEDLILKAKNCLSSELSKIFYDSVKPLVNRYKNFHGFV